MSGQQPLQYGAINVQLPFPKIVYSNYYLMYAWPWADKTVALAMENFWARLKYVRYDLQEPQSARTDYGKLASYKYAYILTMNASNVIINN